MCARVCVSVCARKWCECVMDLCKVYMCECDWHVGVGEVVYMCI